MVTKKLTLLSSGCINDRFGMLALWANLVGENQLLQI